MSQIFSDKMDSYSGKVQNFSLMNILANTVDPEVFKSANVMMIPVDSILKVSWITLGLATLNLILLFSARYENNLQLKVSAETILLKLKDSDGVKVYEGVIDSKSLRNFHGQKLILWLKLLVPVALVFFCFSLTVL